MVVVIGIAAIILVVLGLMWLDKHQDRTTPEQVAEATAALEAAIFEAEEVVGQHAPHNVDCQRLLNQARQCLTFGGHSTPMVVSAGMIKRKRLEGIGLANRAAQIALSGISRA